MQSLTISQVFRTPILLIVIAINAAAQTDTREVVSVDATQGIIEAFKRHPVVLIGEAHWLRQTGDLYKKIVRDPEFQKAVQDIVIEFASRNNQPLLDRYVAGEDVPIEDVRHIWRDTSKVASWESPIYAEWLAAIREVNRGLPPSRRLRVLAGDTPVDWDRIHTHSDWVALGDNNVSIADVVSHEVLGKKHHALVVLGSSHVMKSGDPRGGDNTTTRIESRYPDSTWVVLILHVGAVTPTLEDQLSLPNRTVPALYDLKRTSLATVRDADGSLLISKSDALLDLGPRDALTLVQPTPGSLERAYLKEIDRRSMIEWGELRARKFLGPAAQ